MPNSLASAPGLALLAMSPMLLLATTVLCGCTGFRAAPSTSTATPDPHGKRLEREADLVEQYEAKRAQAQFVAAQQRWEQGDVRGSRDLLERLLVRLPDHPQARLLLSDVALAEGDIAAATKAVEAVLELHPGNAQAQHAMGLIALHSGNVEGAQERFARAVEIEPENKLFALNLQMAAEQTTKADQHAGTCSLGCCGGERGLSRSQQRALLGAARRMETRALLSEAADWLARGETQPALEGFQLAREAEPDNPQIPVAAALAALERGQTSLAYAVLESALRDFPQNAILHRIAGLTFYRLGEYPAAQASLERAIALDSGDPLAYFLLGHTLRRLGRSETAARQFELAGRLDPAFATRR